MASSIRKPTALRFEGKYALVTGASKGIGQAVAIRLAQEGAHVGVHYGSDRKGAEETVEMIKAEGIPEDRTVILQADMANEAQVLYLLAELSLSISPFCDTRNAA
jgi:3-oxoacyl-[acyl-carrier protein] reductase